MAFSFIIVRRRRFFEYVSFLGNLLAWRFSTKYRSFRFFLFQPVREERFSKRQSSGRLGRRASFLSSSLFRHTSNDYDDEASFRNSSPPVHRRLLPISYYYHSSFVRFSLVLFSIIALCLLASLRVFRAIFTI